MSDAPTPISLDELRLAARNHAMPLEALRYPVTPVGLHYLLIHFDIPEVEAGPTGSKWVGSWGRRSPSRSTNSARGQRWSYR